MTGPPLWSARWRHLTADVPPVAFEARREPEDFVVEELLRADTGGTGGHGAHLFVRVEKRGIDTRTAAARLARHLGRRPHEVGYAGLKDARAVARQTLSIEHVEPERVEGLELPGLRVLGAERRDRKLKVGQLLGNRFTLRLRGVDPRDEERLELVLDAVRTRGLPNYYGAQRFGRDGRSHELGRLLLAGREREYLDALLEDDAARPAPELRAARARLARRPEDAAGAVRRVPASLRRLHLAALQSLCFDLVVAARAPALDRLLPGDLAFVHASRACFPVADPGEGDLEERLARLAISPSGPYPGHAVPAATGEPGRIERAAWEELSLAPEAFRRPGPGLAQKGARRPLRVPVEDLRHERLGADVELRFVLPKGSYATVLLEELAKAHGS